MALIAQTFYGGGNALSLYNFTEGADGLLHGLVADDGVVTSINGAVQTVETDTEGDGVAFEPMLFPFEGATLIASADFSAADTRFRIGVRFLDDEKDPINESVTDFIASGRRSHQAVVPQGAVYVQWITTRDDATGSPESWSFTRPALRTTSSTFVF